MPADRIALASHSTMLTSAKTPMPDTIIFDIGRAGQVSHAAHHQA
jgi:hypothetical protein